MTSNTDANDGENPKIEKQDSVESAPAPVIEGVADDDAAATEAAENNPTDGNSKDGAPPLMAAATEPAAGFDASAAAAENNPADNKPAGDLPPAAIADVTTESGDRAASGSATILESVDLPRIFLTPYRPDLIHKVFVNLESHSFQPQGRHPTAGMDVVADTHDPPTGRGIARIARAQGGGGGRRGEGAEVASTRGGRQAHPPVAEKVIYKKINKKEKKLALCSAVAATASKDLIESRGHKVAKYAEQYGDDSFPIVVNDSVAQYATALEVVDLLGQLHMMDDLARLRNRKPRSGRSSLRGRSKKTGKSVLFVIHDDNAALKNAIGALPGVDAKSVGELSVLDLAPGATPIRLTVFTKSAITQIGQIQSTHLQTMIIPEARTQ